MGYFSVGNYILKIIDDFFKGGFEGALFGIH
jgi:hypothetical protein